jgi:hypothetical protein
MGRTRPSQGRRPPARGAFAARPALTAADPPRKRHGLATRTAGPPGRFSCRGRSWRSVIASRHRRSQQATVELIADPRGSLVARGSRSSTMAIMELRLAQRIDLAVSRLARVWTRAADWHRGMPSAHSWSGSWSAIGTSGDRRSCPAARGARPTSHRGELGARHPGLLRRPRWSARNPDAPRRGLCGGRCRIHVATTVALRTRDRKMAQLTDEERSNG